MLKLALLWHMHQPYYEDLATGEHILPWVRMHALKDYWGMVALLREFPGISLTFNLVPSLLVQVEAFAADRAHDRHLLIGLKPADTLEPAEREFLIANGFHAPLERMIRPYPRYFELYARRARREPFDVDDLRDLQVLHKLVWMDPDWLTSDLRLQSLIAKERRYDEEDKAVLRGVELELLRAVVPAYRAAAATGRVELSTSPFYHPILPLLCDTDVHLRAHPASPLPGKLFRRPEDAALQLRRALDYHARLFGETARGVWPSEGSVSDEVIALMARAGCEWTATDEDILGRSLQRPVSADDLYQPHAMAVGNGSLRVLFRDHRLSDLIGFTYQSWDAAAAAGDFVRQVRAAARRCSSSVATPLVTVILDGENAWEHYAGGGRPFLRALYRELEDAPDIETVAMRDAAAGPARPLASIFPGSWINGDFYIWAGHRDDHRAWAQVAAARDVFDRSAPEVPETDRDRALEELLIAEGSDWFWWYGDDHSSDHDREFDDLFRRHLRNVYRALGQVPPDELHGTNITTAPRAGARPALAALTTSDLASDDYQAWRLSAEVAIGEAGGAMHRVAGLLKRLGVAADRQNVYLRLDGPELAALVSSGAAGVALLVEGPEHLRLAADGSTGAAGLRVAAGGLTLSAPFADLRAQAGDIVRLSVLVLDSAGDIRERHPEQGPIELIVPFSHHDAIHWVV